MEGERRPRRKPAEFIGRGSAAHRGIAHDCRGCGQLYHPRVAEHLCPTCIAALLADPDPWLRHWLG